MAANSKSKAQALYDFWAGFTWPAYDEGAVPDSAALPYITYETQTNCFDDGPMTLSASLWDRSTSWETVEAKAAAIADHLGEGGVLMPYTNGRLWIHRGNPFTQRLQEPDDDSLRRIVVSFTAEFFS